MKLTKKRALRILNGIRTELYCVNLNMHSFLRFKGALNNSIPVRTSKALFTKTISAPDAMECNTSCCLAGMIPMIDWEWAKAFDNDFLKMSTALAEAILPKGSEEIMVLWDWLFSANWNNNKDWARERLDLVLDTKGYYSFHIRIDCQAMNSVEEFLRLTDEDDRNFEPITNNKETNYDRAHKEGI